MSDRDVWNPRMTARRKSAEHCPTTPGAMGVDIPGCSPSPGRSEGFARAFFAYVLKPLTLKRPTRGGGTSGARPNGCLFSARWAGDSSEGPAREGRDAAAGKLTRRGRSGKRPGLRGRDGAAAAGGAPQGAHGPGPSGYGSTGGARRGGGGGPGKAERGRQGQTLEGPAPARPVRVAVRREGRCVSSPAPDVDGAPASKRA